jgi:hypothetical protein
VVKNGQLQQIVQLMENIAASGLDFEWLQPQAEGDPMRIYWSLKIALKVAPFSPEERGCADDFCLGAHLAATARSC